MYQFKLDSWYIAVRKAYDGAILSDLDTPFHVFCLPNNGWAADPFVFVKNDVTYVFAEFYDYKFGKGCISYITIDENLIQNCSWKCIIEEPYHLSFPFIFEEDGDIYIMPESNRGNCLSKYKAIDFPDKWEKQDIDSGHRFADTALFRMNERLFGYTLELKTDTDQAGRIFSYKKNQIDLLDEIYSLNKKNRRLGGAFFECNGRMIKCAQDCTDTYGGALVFSEFFQTDKKFDEKIIKEIKPQEIKLDKRVKLSGIHTYNCINGVEIIDIKSKRLSLVQRFWNLVRKISRR